jgi:radical SAM protein with 4Fe4S-binding SPASM domain
MIRYISSKNIGVIMSSNLVRLSEGDIRELVDSGLEYLTVSLDGTTQEVYSQYRVRGNLDAALDHLRAILDYRQASGSQTPLIEWQFIVMKHNEHQTEEARRLAHEIGVDVLRFIPAGLPFDAGREERQAMAERWMATNPSYRTLELKPGQDYLLDERCFYLYRSMTINPEGGVAPCCIIYDERYDFGDIRNESLETLWNNKRYRSARSLYTTSKDPTARIGTVCHKCPIYRRIPH